VNYSAAKMGILGLSTTLAKEGEKKNVLTNVVIPVAASRMTETIMPPDVLENIKPEFIVPLGNIEINNKF
jgi:multifunctional beta-oxidation protein